MADDEVMLQIKPGEHGSSFGAPPLPPSSYTTVGIPKDPLSKILNISHLYSVIYCH